MIAAHSSSHVVVYTKRVHIQYLCALSLNKLANAFNFLLPLKRDPQVLTVL